MPWTPAITMPPPTMPDTAPATGHLEILAGLGFALVGTWSDVFGELRPRGDFHAMRGNCLYAFVLGPEVVYLGKTNRGLKARLMGYATPGPTQRTNLRVHAVLVQYLAAGGNVDIYGYACPGHLTIGPFTLDTAAGLESPLIRALQPRLNQMG